MFRRKHLFVAELHLQNLVVPMFIPILWLDLSLSGVKKFFRKDTITGTALSMLNVTALKMQRKKRLI